VSDSDQIVQLLRHSATRQLRTMATQSMSSVLSAHNVAFGVKLVSLCMILGLAFLGVGTGLVLNLYVYASRYALHSINR
jgi:hypothetical protein